MLEVRYWYYLFLSSSHGLDMNSQTAEAIWNGLSANTEPQNPVVYHHVPYQKVIFWGIPWYTQHFQTPRWIREAPSADGHPLNAWPLSLEAAHLRRFAGSHPAPNRSGSHPGFVRQKWGIYFLYIYMYTLWLFNIAMENCPFINGLPN